MMGNVNYQNTYTEKIYSNSTHSLAQLFCFDLYPVKELIHLSQYGPDGIH